MRRTASTILALLVAGLAPAAAAHPTGHEARTPADCDRLAGTPQEALRPACVKCVGLDRPHHFHPDLPPGTRCQPDAPAPVPAPPT